MIKSEKWEKIIGLTRDVEFNLVTDGLESILHQPECSSWEAEYTEIGAENGGFLLTL